MNGIVNSWQTFADGRAVDTLGWVLLHSIWQFAVVAAVTFVVVQLLRKRSARSRYRVLLAAMMVIVVSATVTCGWLVYQDVRWPSKAVEVVVEEKGDGLGRPSYEEAPPRELRSGSPFFYEIEPTTPGKAQPETTNVPVVAETATFAQEPSPNDYRDAFQQTSALIKPWLPIIVTAWLIGIVVCAFRPLIGWYTVLRLRRVGTSPVPANIQALFDKTTQRLRVRAIVSVLQSTIVNVPVVVGYFKPIVLLPTSVVAELPMSQIEAILAHELAHVRRFDYVVNIGQTIIETLFFYHPAVWWLSRQVRVEREHCCDDDVVRTLDNRRDYGEALLAMTEMQASGGVLALGAGGSSLLSRVRRLCGIEPTHRSWSSVLACLLVLLIGVGAIGFAWQATADDDEREKKVHDVVTIKLLGDPRLKKPPRYRIDVPFVGYPGDGKVHRTIKPNDDGLFVLNEIAAGTHTLMATDAGASGYWKRIFKIELPNEKEHIDVSLVPQGLIAAGPPREKKSPVVGEVTVRDGDFDVRPTIVVQVKNEGDTPWPIGDYSHGSIQLVGNDYRVFIPKGLFKNPGEISPGNGYYIHLDWPLLVTQGLWVSRAGEAIDEPMLPDDEKHLGFRMKVWGGTTKHFQLPRPEIVLAQLAAMKKAKTRVKFAKRSYFIGEHMPIHLVVKNEAERDIRVEWGGDSRAPRPLRFKIVATKDGKRVPDPHPSPWCMGGVGSTQTVKPGDDYDMGELALQSYCALTEPGVYRVQVYHDLGWEAWSYYHADGPVPQNGNWIPTTPTLAPIASAKLEIKAPTAEQAAGVVKRMRENFPNGYLSDKMFSSLQSNAYLPALRSWIDENGGSLDKERSDRHEELYGRTAIVGIGGIWTPEATKLLIELLSHEDLIVARDAAKALGLRLPNPQYMTKPAEQLAWNQKPREFIKRAWREEFRQPTFDFALKLLEEPNLPAHNANKKAVDEATANRKSRMRAAGMLQAVARQDDYPKLRDVAARVTREYRDHAEEQGAYPRPPTVTQGLIAALWYSFNNGNIEYGPQPQSREFVFNTENLDQLFADGKIDEFTTATLLKEVKTFRPDGWEAWVLERLRSDLPWMRCHMMERLPDPNDTDVRKAIARNINHPMRAVQAAAITIAEKSPSDVYVPALGRAIERGDEWIKPAAESALKATRSEAPASERTAPHAPPADGAQKEAEPQEQSVPRQEPGNEGAADRASKKTPPTIQVVSTWQDLLDQTPIKLEEGTARVGIDRIGATFPHPSTNASSPP